MSAGYWPNTKYSKGLLLKRIQTLGGLAVDTSARSSEGVWVAGADAGGISTGGWASGLASALVLGLVAAESALGHAG